MYPSLKKCADICVARVVLGGSTRPIGHRSIRPCLKQETHDFRVTLQGCPHQGSGAIVVPGIEVGEGAMVGAGAVVTKAPEANQLVAGMPARRVRELDAF